VTPGSTRLLRVGLIVAGVLLALGLAFGLLDWLTRGGDAGAFTRAEHTADVIVDSAPAWRKEAADSQRVLDSLDAETEKARVQRDRDARDLARIRHQTDSLRRVMATEQADLDSATGQRLPPTATASDTARHWWAIADRQHQLLVTANETVASCVEGDGIYLRREAGMTDDLTRCARSKGILARQQADTRVRLDRAVATLDTLRQGEPGCRYLVVSVPCPDVIVVGGITTDHLYGGGGIEVGGGNRVALRAVVTGSRDGAELRVEGRVRLRRIRF
jgi:hypothetical protein